MATGPTSGPAQTRPEDLATKDAPTSGEASSEPNDLKLETGDGVTLEAHVALPRSSAPAPGILLLHGFPSGSIPAAFIGNDLPELADRIATEMGWVALSLRLRGCGTSTGNFSLSGWLEDARTALAHLRSLRPLQHVWVCGFGTGGAIALLLAADDAELAGVAVLGTPGNFADWARSPDTFLAQARAAGVIRDDEFPADIEAWSAELSSTRATDGAERMGDRPLLVMHGAEDEWVPQFDARSVADSHGAADLRVIAGAGHQLRHDPRAVAVLLGWLDRHRNT